MSFPQTHTCLEAWGRPLTCVRPTCFETHRSATVKWKRIHAWRCDAPQHEGQERSPAFRRAAFLLPRLRRHIERHRRSRMHGLQSAPPRRREQICPALSEARGIELAICTLAICTIEWYNNSSWGCGMIVSFRDGWLRDFFVEDVRSKKIPSDLESRLFRKIQMIDDATTDQDLRVPPSNHFEKLRGDLEGFHSIRVNKQWRLIFQWDGGRGEATGVYLDDHSYR